MTPSLSWVGLPHFNEIGPKSPKEVGIKGAPQVQLNLLIAKTTVTFCLSESCHLQYTTLGLEHSVHSSVVLALCAVKSLLWSWTSGSEVVGLEAPATVPSLDSVSSCVVSFLFNGLFVFL